MAHQDKNKKEEKKVENNSKLELKDASKPVTTEYVFVNDEEDEVAEPQVTEIVDVEVPEEPKEEIKEESIISVKPVEFEQEVKEEKVEFQESIQPKAEEPKVKEAKEAKEVKGQSKPNEIVYVEGKMIFNSPEGPGFVFHGNVRIIDIIGGITRVEYVRPGLGVVLGYIRNEDL